MIKGSKSSGQGRGREMTGSLKAKESRESGTMFLSISSQARISAFQRPQDLIFSKDVLEKAFSKRGSYSILQSFDEAERSDREADQN